MLNLIKKLELVLFYLFVFSIPLEKRHVFETGASRIDGNFIEWNSAALYLSDILFGLFILLWIVRFLISKTTAKKGIRFPIGNRIPVMLIIFSSFILISLISTIYSDFVKLSLYQLTKLVEYGLLFFYVVYNIKTTKKIIYTLLAFIASGLLQSALGIIQYLKQSSLGLKIFGEVDLSPTIQNISKIDVAGEKMIRAYGTFPHSNVLAGFLFISIIFTVCLIFIILNKDSISSKSLAYSKIKKMFHVEHFSPFILNKLNSFLKLPIFVFMLYALSLGLLLTFSRSGWLACLLSVVFIALSILFILKDFRRLLVRQFKKNFSKINVFIVLVVLIGITSTILWPQIISRNINTNPEDEYSLSGRTLYNQLASDTIRENSLLGVGSGLFVSHSGKYLSEDFVWWQLQPVHNVYLLLLAEHGILGFVAFIVFILYVLSQIKNISFKQKGDYYINQILVITLASILFSFFIIMLFDHYLWTIQQGALCFWIVLGLFYKSTKLSN